MRIYTQKFGMGILSHQQELTKSKLADERERPEAKLTDINVRRTEQSKKIVLLEADLEAGKFGSVMQYGVARDTLEQAGAVMDLIEAERAKTTKELDNIQGREAEFRRTEDAARELFHKQRALNAKQAELEETEAAIRNLQAKLPVIGMERNRLLAELAEAKQLTHGV